MNTLLRKYFSCGCICTLVISIILLTLRGVFFFHYKNDHISAIVVYILSWWQLFIVYAIIVFCIYAYRSIENMKRRFEEINKSIEDMKNTMNTRFGRVDKRIEDMENTMNTGFEEVDKSIEDIKNTMNTRFKEIDIRIDDIESSISTNSSE